MSENEIIQKVENKIARSCLSEGELLAIREEVADDAEVEEKVAAIFERLNKLRVSLPGAKTAIPPMIS